MRGKPSAWRISPIWSTKSAIALSDLFVILIVYAVQFVQSILNVQDISLFRGEFFNQLRCDFVQPRRGYADERDAEQ
jgi:hypothetical protein